METLAHPRRHRSGPALPLGRLDLHSSEECERPRLALLYFIHFLSFFPPVLLRLVILRPDDDEKRCSNVTTRFGYPTTTILSLPPRFPVFFNFPQFLSFPGEIVERNCRRKKNRSVTAMNYFIRFSISHNVETLYFYCNHIYEKEKRDSYMAYIFVSTFFSNF